MIDRLLLLGFAIVNIDNLNDTYDPDIKRRNIVRHYDYKNYQLKKIDVRSAISLEQVFRQHQIDRIIHLAALTGVRNSIVNPLPYQEVNIGGTYNLLELAKKYAIKQFIIASSSSIYGNAKTPFVEDEPAILPLSPYAATKRSAELICWTYHILHQLPVTILRLFSVYGARGRPDMAPYLFTKSILGGSSIEQFGNGTSARDWTYIDDIIEGFVLSIEHPQPFSILNLGSSKPTALSEFIKILEKSCEKKAIIKTLKPRAEESRITYAKINRARAVLGWKPKTSFEKGMQLFVQWYKSSLA